MFRYFSEKYSRYAEVWPYELTQLTSDYSFGRLVPSRGITINQVSEICSRFGFSPELYFREAVEQQFPNDADAFKRLLFYYVESGLPCVVSLPGHAMTVFGHISDKSKILQTGDLIDNFHYLQAFVVNDDNHLPYQVLPVDKSSSNQHPEGCTLNDVEAIIVPLYDKIHFLGENADVVARAILTDPAIGLKACANNLDPSEVVLRTFLTTARSYKNDRTKKMPENLARLYAYWPMHQFIWVTELSTRALYPKNEIVGEIIFDATASALDPFSFMIVHYPELLIINDRHSLSEKPDERLTIQPLTQPQPYASYRHNLKEVT